MKRGEIIMRVDNSAIIAYLSSVYLSTSAAKTALLGFPIENNVYAAFIPIETLLTEFSGVSLTSDENPCKRLRVKPLTKKTMTLFQSFEPFYICTFDELQTLAKRDFSGNCGVCFESVCAEKLNAKQSAPNTPFWIDGDFSLENGKKVQCKFQLATIITEYSAKQAETECNVNA